MSWRSVILAFAVTAGLVFAASAAAEYDADDVYYSGALTSGEGSSSSYVYWCAAGSRTRQLWGTDMDVDVGYGTVALIDGGGGWYASNRSQGPIVLVTISPSPPRITLKAHCKNSTPWQVTYYTDCHRAWRVFDSYCV